MNNEYINNIPHIYYFIGGIAVTVLYTNTLHIMSRYNFCP